MVVDDVVEPTATRTALAESIAGAGLVLRGAHGNIPLEGLPVSQGARKNWHTPDSATAGVCHFPEDPGNLTDAAATRAPVQSGTGSGRRGRFSPVRSGNVLVTG